MIESRATFDVGGVILDRPFKIRRLGHVGVNAVRMEESLRFYRDLCGLRVSDRIDMGERAKPGELHGLGDPGGYFMRHGTDHHSFVLFNRRVRETLDKTRKFPAGVTINQISWQVGSLEEVTRGDEWLREQGAEIQRVGRDWPGSNWHTYFYDPDGHTNELFYGMEQVGWDGHSKPEAMEPNIRLREKPQLPQPSEEDEIRAALAKGIDLQASPVHRDELPRVYEVEGVMLGRPFRVTKIGPLSLFVKDLEASQNFYEQRLGLVLTEETRVNGFPCKFLRATTEHHSLVLMPIEARAQLGLWEGSTTMAIGMQVASYRQLRDAREFFASRGAKLVDLPTQLHCGIDYAFHVLDPDGHCLQFYFMMEQVGWKGEPRPADMRPHVDNKAWPDVVPPQSDFGGGEVFMGPLG
jgi:catechol 2,3-dioxygenase-like lactoylglutathione lyase family enzyme